MSIIGRKYIAVDNSYSINLTKPIIYDRVFGRVTNKPYLTGSANTNPIICIIKSLPINIITKHGLHKMIVVTTPSNEDCLVMYHKRGLIIQERIDAINRHIIDNDLEQDLLIDN